MLIINFSAMTGYEHRCHVIHIKSESLRKGEIQLERFCNNLCCVLSAEEEKDVDEWDIDMSVYYEEGAGDKDARDMMTMRREVRRREGHCDPNALIGKFETHTKVNSSSFFTSLSFCSLNH